MDEEELRIRREVVQLCSQHISEVEELETRRFLDKIGADRSELLKQSDSESDGERTSKTSKPTARREYGQEGEKDPTRKALFEGRKKTKSMIQTNQLV
jgi:hypothetical protein